MARKITLVLAIAVLATGWVFAQEEGHEGVSFSSETKAYFAPLIFMTDAQDKGEKQENTGYVGAGQNWAKSSFGLEGAWDYAGFALSMVLGAGVSTDGNVEWDGDATAWVTPFGNNMLKLQGGGFTEDYLRGKVGGVNGDFHNYFVIPNSYAVAFYNPTTGDDVTIGSKITSGDQDAIFTRFKARKPFFGTDGQLFVLSSKLLEDSLFVGVGVTAPLFSSGNNFAAWSVPRNAANVYRTTQVGVGYKIDGIGFARAQFLGGFVNVDWNDKKDNAWAYGNGGDDSEFAPNLPVAPGRWNYEKNAAIQAAFQLTAVENLNLDLGFTFNLPTTEKNLTPGSEITLSNGIVVALGAQWKQDVIRVNGRVDFAAAQKHEVKDGETTNRGVGLGFAFSPAYMFADNTWVGFDFGMGYRGATTYKNQDDAEDARLDLGFGLFLEKSISHATLTCGVAYALPGTTNGDAHGQGRISVPVLLKVSF